jgi:hypothetical protein
LPTACHAPLFDGFPQITAGGVPDLSAYATKTRVSLVLANKGFRRFLKTPKGDGFVIDRAKIEADARFDGLFVLRTNTKIAALQVVLRYRNLLAVEDAFRTAKALLATRPIFHKTDAGIRGHVFCTFLALVLRKELIDRLAARHSKLEWQRIIDDLADLSERAGWLCLDRFPRLMSGTSAGCRCGLAFSGWHAGRA